MPNPQELKIGDFIKYISRPEEWKQDGFHVDDWDKIFLDLIIKRGRWQRISDIDEYGNRWFNAFVIMDGKREHHTWAVMEKTGWVKMERKIAQQVDAAGPADAGP